MGDPRDGHLLVDGGYLDNLPIDTMRAKGLTLTLTQTLPNPNLNPNPLTITLTLTLKPI